MNAAFVLFVGATLFLFASLRIYDHGRVIQMNMEIALILAHSCLLLPDFSDKEQTSIPMVGLILILRLLCSYTLGKSLRRCNKKPRLTGHSLSDLIKYKPKNL